MTQFKTINLCVTVTALHLLGVLQATHAAQPTNWKLVWSDEFDGPTLDYSKWGVEVNAYGGGNNELQIYSDRLKNVRLEKGHLIIEAHKDGYAEAGTRRDYSSGRIRTKHRGDWRYGRIDVRAKLPVGKGIWPAIWMLPTDDAYGTWAASGEIDIMELVGHEPSTYHGTLHYGGKWPKNKHTGKSYKLSSGTFADDFSKLGLTKGRPAYGTSFLDNREVAIAVLPGGDDPDCGAQCEKLTCPQTTSCSLKTQTRSSGFTRRPSPAGKKQSW